MRLLEFLDKSGEASLPSGSAEIALGSLHSTVPSSSPPIEAKSSDWITIPDPERIVKVFNFNTFNHMIYFINELMEYQEDVQHHAKIVVGFRDIAVESYTHDIESVTRQDLALAEFCDEIYGDVVFLDYAREDVER